MAFTFFFRDSETLRLAIEDALPGLRGRGFIHVWDAGCAHGAEPYTLAMMMRERMPEDVFCNVRIHATDVDASFAAQVRSGVFAEQEVRRVPPEIVHKYFRPAARRGSVEAVPELRSRITFAQHDLLSLRAVREGLSLIVCKNVLLHFDERRRVAVLRMFRGALQPGGTLVLENTQKLPAAVAPSFRQIDPWAQVHRKLDSAVSPEEGWERGRDGHSRVHRTDARADGPQPPLLDSRLARR